MDPPKDDQEPMEEESDEELSPIEQAMKAVRSGMSQNKAAKTFNVCRATLANKLKGRHLGRWGGQCRFDPPEELILLEAMKQCRALGLQINRQKNIKVVEKMAASKGVDPAKFETPWLRGILRRYPLEGLDSTASDKEEDAEAVAEASVQMTDASISIADMNLPLSKPKPSFADLQAELCGAELMKELHGGGFLEDPQGLWVIVESLISVKGYYRKYYGASNTPGSEKPLRVLVCCNASGSFLPPCVLVPKDLNDPENRNFEQFSQLARQHLFPLLSAQKNVILLDRAATQLRREPDFVMACSESDKEIKLLPFPRGKISQNWSVKAAAVLNKCWCIYLKTAYIHSDAQPNEGNLYDVVEHLKKAWTKLPLKKVIQTAFEKTGLYPYKPEALAETVEAKVLVTGRLKAAVRRLPHKQKRAAVRQLLTDMGLTKEQYLPIMNSIRRHLDANLPEGQRLTRVKPLPKRTKEQIAAEEATFLEEEI
ncbi:hypothetical protein RvY_17329 [Ramazzottius varieornatus]|uniref:HTH psq-type domain-containing protein n=1 Tax=Ramazzottius varieornatus TaxID=947166 RepID=A0A1D1W3Z8_RAMVA|nr:hypothetical protein RvY_17329 [Ramazzottius varieornatus]